MTVDSFTVDEFVLLAQAWVSYPIRKTVERGEWVLFLPLDKDVQVKIRTSTSPRGISAGAGDNSIRLFMVSNDDQLLLMSRQEYFKRTEGWADRVRDEVEYFKAMRKASGNCPECGFPFSVFVSHTANNPNRKFAKCKQCTKFVWLDQIRNPILTDMDGKRQEELPLPSDLDDAGEQEILALVRANMRLDDEQAEPPDPRPAVAALPAGLEETDWGEIVPVVESQVVVSYAPNEEQLKVIEAPLEGAFRVNAGPGSGKTFVLAHRYNYLVQHGISPDRIVAVTFGKKAAGELHDRIIRVNPLLTGTGADQWVTTIHAFCYRIGKQYGLFDKDVSVVEGRMMWKVKQIVEDLISSVYGKVDDAPLWKETYEWIGTAKSRGIELETTQAVKFFLNCGFSQYHAGRVAEIWQGLEQAMVQSKLITFSHMVYAVDILLAKDAQFKANLRRQFSHVILDEGQDTSNQAMRILSAVSDNFMIVGDIDQLLYRFAGATPEANLLDGFEQRYPGGELFNLNRNHRSSLQVVQASRMIAQNYEDAGGPYEQKYFKPLEAVRDLIGDIQLVKTLNPMDDARHAVDIIQAEAKALQMAVTDVAERFFLTVRVRAYSMYLEDAMVRSGIPFINATGMSFWSQAHVKKLVAYLRLARDVKDTEAWGLIYQIPSRDWRIDWNKHPKYGEYMTTHMLGRGFLFDYPTYQQAIDALHPPIKYAAALEDIHSIMREVDQALQEDVRAAIRTLIAQVFTKYLTWEDGAEAVTDGEGGKLDVL